VNTFAHPCSCNKDVVRRIDPDFLDASVLEKFLKRPKPQQLVPQILTKWLSGTVAREERDLIGDNGGHILPRIDQAVPHSFRQSRSGIECWGHGPMVPKVT
jgi:hypothetical protein